MPERHGSLSKAWIDLKYARVPALSLIYCINSCSNVLLLHVVIS
jgi:hypothetical protein